MANEQPIIVIKKKGGHGGHHGGAWKVAYADLVTALMALFIVLWLLASTSKPTQEAIAGYFRDPSGTPGKHGSAMHGAEKPASAKDDMAKLKEAVLRAIFNDETLKKLKGQIEITITDEGLRIEMIEDKKGTFFETGSPQPTPVLKELLTVLSVQLGSLPNKISVEGHTDAQPYSAAAVYGNWELSSDRANVARRLMQANGVREDQISQVRGFADQRLRKADQPLDPSNRRVSVIVQYLAESGKAGPQAEKSLASLPDGAVVVRSAKPPVPAAAADSKPSASSATTAAPPTSVTPKPVSHGLLHLLGK